MNLQKNARNLFVAACMLCLSAPLFAQIQVAEVSKDTSLRIDQYGNIVTRTPLNVERRSGLLVFESKNQEYRFWLDLRAQADGAVFFSKDNFNEIGNGAMIRRARAGFKAYLTKRWYAELDLDFAGSSIELKDVILQYRFHNDKDGILDVGGIKAGNFKESFSMEATTTSRYLTFLERPMAVNAFAPSRHLGVQGFYNWKFLTGFAGIHFQDIGDSEVVAFSQAHNKDEGTSEGYSYTGKLVVMPFYNKADYGLHLGGAFSYRTPKTDAEIANSVRYSTRNETSINRKKYVDTDNITDVDHMLLGGAEAAAYYKGFKVQSEYIWNSVHRYNNLETEKQHGFYVFGSAMLFGGRYSYDPAEAEFGQPKRGKKWGDLEAAFRYDYINMNGTNIMGGASEAYTVGLNYYPTVNLKFMLNYTYINNDRYANGKGKYNVGHDVSGNLTPNYKVIVEPEGQGGDDYGFLALRIQVSF